jgi:hypothetical protein
MVNKCIKLPMDSGTPPRQCLRIGNRDNNRIIEGCLEADNRDMDNNHTVNNHMVNRDTSLSHRISLTSVANNSKWGMGHNLFMSNKEDLVWGQVQVQEQVYVVCC